MQLTMETVMIKSFLQFKGGSAPREQVETLLKEFAAESQERKRELATAAAAALGIPLSSWSWVPLYPPETWSVDELAKLRHAHGDVIAETYLETLRDDPIPKNRAIAGMILVDMVWSDTPLISPSMSRRIMDELRMFLSREQVANVLGFVRMHVHDLAKKSNLKISPTRTPHLEPSRN